MSESVNMGYIQKLLDLCICSNYQNQSRTYKKSFVLPTHLLVVNADTLMKREASFYVEQEIARTILGTNKRGQRCGLIGL